jgi:hypothetical protein
MTSATLQLLALCAGLACRDRDAPTPVTAPSVPAPPPTTTTSAPPDAAPAPAPTSPVDVSLVLAAACDPASSAPSSLAVTLSVPAARRPVFHLDDEVMGTSGMANLIVDATADDERGPLPLVRRVRHGVLELAAARDSIGPVRLRYLARGVSLAHDGAREGLRYDTTGVGGLGQHFLVLPASRQRYRMRVAWSTPTCPATADGEGMSSFGGADPSDAVGQLDALRTAVYYWGRPQRTTTDDATVHLRTAWFGEPALDVPAAGAWAARMFAAERAFFADDDPAPFSIFVRVLQSHADRANGVAQDTSMLSTIGPGTTLSRRLQINIAHEMLHRWLGLRLRLRGAEGSAYWFTEGFTVHYSNRIAFRAGLIGIDDFLESINDIATRHFENKRAGATNAEIRRDFYRDPAVSIVPYTRGALYAAELDAALRRASDGKRTLDDVLRELYRDARTRTDGAGLPPDAIRTLVAAELGRDGVERYQAVIVRGADPDPPSDAYGPCFARTPREPKGFTWARVAGADDTACRAW